MCFVLIAFNAHPDFPLVVAANRDEFFARPARAAHWWTGQTPILAGRDETAGGTWLGVNDRGRFAVVTNLRTPDGPRPDRMSRGFLVTRVLGDIDETQPSFEHVVAEPERYNPFNLLYGDAERLYYLNNRDGTSAKALGPGVHVLSNAVLGTSWPKVLDGKQHLEALLRENSLDNESLFRLLSNPLVYDRKHLPDTGLSADRERALSAIFIRDQDYGTRCSTVFRIDSTGHAYFEERNHAGTFDGPRHSQYSFRIRRPR